MGQGVDRGVDPSYITHIGKEFVRRRFVLYLTNTNVTRCY